MIVQSEGEKMKHIHAPARDKKYVLVAFTKFLLELNTVAPPNVKNIIVSSLIDLSAHTSTFQLASIMSVNDTEELL
jgi:hypothetical protein